MATYAIGDIQGCHDALQRLLEKIAFEPSRDKLWFVGDLVNRGPQSLETIQFIRSLDTSAQCVLGNHDVHLIACHAGIQTCKPSSSLQQILQHAQADDIINWLRQQPLFYFDPELNWAMVHAGLLPQWDHALAQQCAHEVESHLRSDRYVDFLEVAYGDEPALWHDQLSTEQRCRISLNAFTRLRLCDQQGRMNFSYKGPLGEQPQNLYAWFDVARKSSQLRIIFGHWSALGLQQRDNLLAIDTGCLWGQQLTAVQIDTEIPIIHQYQCAKKPSKLS